MNGRYILTHRFGDRVIEPVRCGLVHQSIAQRRSDGDGQIIAAAMMTSVLRERERAQQPARLAQ